MSQFKVPALAEGTYRHTKSGKLYRVIGVALETESDQAVVVYSPLYEHESGYRLFTRPYEMFVGMVEIDGELVHRFQKTDD